MTTTTTAVFAVPLAYGRWVKSLVERILWLNSLCNMDAIKVIVLRCRKYESKDSSSSDDEWKLVLRKRKKRTLRPRILNYVDIVDRYMDYDFKNYFRMSKATFELLLQMLRPYLTRQIKGSPMIPPHHQ
ncbi:PREDICTED: uncharacterized protein LOC105153243 [Acromyrmex echinatior]|uniref:Uncharacterized protein n=1 Tax=Acromyrmex echinatior TaxID=103372 RepID=F4X637_ACREC|nr:PREDICTED: uncharacterized protein LOC105153243 [Acromyrmex echinatior]EGI58083.1 hypothetical protein G5I_13835 [Acromyrmex echinatior]